MAAARPARPAPMTITPVLGSEGFWRGEEEVGESCAEDWGLNLNRFGEEKKERFVQGRENSVTVVIGVWIRFSVDDQNLSSFHQRGFILVDWFWWRR